MSFLKAALCYRKQDYSVIPIKPKGKTPLVKWEKYQNRRAFKHGKEDLHCCQ